MKNKIPFLDLSIFYKKNAKEILNAITKTLKSSDFILSSEVVKFEKNYARYSSSKYCVAVSNGLDALKLLLLAYDIGPGDEVIVPSNTFIATWLSVSHVGAIPVPVEPDDETYNISPELIREKISKKTKAIICVHLYGNPADIKPIRKIANDNKLFLFEDMAQAHGAKYYNKDVGNLGHGAAVSFYPGKNLGAYGDAGAILINNKKIDYKLRKLRNYGSLIKYQTDLIGYNARMDSIQASILNLKLKSLDIENKHRNKLASRYLMNLKNVHQLKLPVVKDFSNSAWHLFVIRLKKRDELASYLNKKGIQTLIHYPIPPHKQLAYKEMDHLKNLNLRKTSKMAKEILSLPISGYLSIASVDYISKQIIKFFSK